MSSERAEDRSSRAPGDTTVAVQRILDGLATGVPSEPVVRELLERSARRLQVLCAHMLRTSYPRLSRGPAALETNDLLAGVVVRLLMAMREIRPPSVRQFFALANRHMRWELNEVARRSDAAPRREDLDEDLVASPTNDSEIGPSLRRMLESIEALPEEVRETLDLVRIQGLTHAEAAAVLGVSTKTVQRRLNEALLLLAERVGEVEPRPNS